MVALAIGLILDWKAAGCHGVDRYLSAPGRPLAGVGGRGWRIVSGILPNATSVPPVAGAR